MPEFDEDIKDSHQYQLGRLQQAEKRMEEASLSKISGGWERAALAEKFLNKHQEELQELRRQNEIPQRLKPLIQRVRKKAWRELERIETEYRPLQKQVQYPPPQQTILKSVLEKLERRGQRRLKTGQQYQQEIKEKHQRASKELPRRFWTRHKQKVEQELIFRKKLHTLQRSREEKLLFEPESPLAGKPAQFLATFIQRLEADRLNTLLREYPEVKRQEILEDPPLTLQRHMSGWQQHIGMLATNLVGAMAVRFRQEQKQQLKGARVGDFSTEEEFVEAFKETVRQHSQLTLEQVPPPETHKTKTYLQWQEAGHGLEKREEGATTLHSSTDSSPRQSLPKLVQKTDEIAKVLGQSYETLDAFIDQLRQVGREDWVVAFQEKTIAESEDVSRHNSPTLHEGDDWQGHANNELRLIELTPAVRDSLTAFAHGGREPGQVQSFLLFIHEAFHGFSAWVPSEEVSYSERWNEEEALEEGMVEWLSRTVVARSLYGVEWWDQVPDELQEAVIEAQKREADDPTLRRRQMQFIQSVYETGGLEAVGYIWAPTTGQKRFERLQSIFRPGNKRSAQWPQLREAALNQQADQIRDPHAHLPTFPRIGGADEHWRAHHPVLGPDVSQPKQNANGRDSNPPETKTPASQATPERSRIR